MKLRVALTLIAALLISGCGGGGSPALPSAPAPSSPGGAMQKIKMALVIPLPSKTTSGKRASFVSPSAAGASIAVSGSHGGSATTVADISSASSACTTSAGQRTCTVTASAPFDTDTFTISLYDAAPVSGSIPATAHLLSTGSVTQTITSSFTGPLSVFVGGQIANIGLSSTYASAAADGTAQSLGITVAPTDFGNNPIVAGTSDPYANPIAVSLSETGGSGHMHLVLNGSPSGTSATLTTSSDSISIAYDGGGSAGYSAAVTLSASGAASETLAVSPMFVTSTSPLYASGTLSLSGSASTIPITVQEASAPASLSYTVALSGCTNIASNTAVTGTGVSSSFNVTGGTTASASGCAIQIADGITTQLIHVVNSPNGATIPLPGNTITEYTVQTNASNPPASPDAMTEGPDGRIWFTDVLNGQYGAITTGGTITLYPNTFATYSDIVAGPDGKMYGLTSLSGSDYVSKFDPTTGANIAYYHMQGPGNAITVGPDGKLWFTEGGSNPQIGSVMPSGNLTEYSINPIVGASPDPRGIIKGPDGQLWFCDNYNSRIDTIDVNGNFAVAVDLTQAQPAGASGTGCSYLTVDANNKIWVAGNSSGVVQIDPFTKQVLAVVPISSGMGITSHIAAGADYAVYVSDGAKLARISILAGNSVTEYSPPTTPSSVRGIAQGPDGRIWFSEDGINKVGALTP
ncbi:MAG TPA: hypothetical protein VFN49_11695 [Candidatus Aquilonibacter sp.]|nr:hypothetical protein [Candidatus Aquilonibacter sp.]